MASYPVEPMYDAYGKPLAPSEYPHAGYPMAPQYPGMPPQYPVMQPGPYPPHMMDPAYSQGKSSHFTDLQCLSLFCSASMLFGRDIHDLMHNDKRAMIQYIAMQLAG